MWVPTNASTAIAAAASLLLIVAPTQNMSPLTLVVSLRMAMLEPMFEYWFQTWAVAIRKMRSPLLMVAEKLAGVAVQPVLV